MNRYSILEWTEPFEWIVQAATTLAVEQLVDHMLISSMTKCSLTNLINIEVVESLTILHWTVHDLGVRWWTWEWISATACWVEFGSAIRVVDGTRHVTVINPERDNHTWDATHRVRRERARKYFDKVAPSVVDHWSGCLNVRQPGCTRRLTLELVRHHPVGRLRKDQRAWNITRSNWNSEIQFINSVSQLSNIP